MRVVERHRFRKTGDAGLRSAVSRTLLPGDNAQDGSDVDYRATSGCAKMRQCRARDEKRASKIRRDHAFPILVRCIIGRGYDNGPSVVHYDVQAAELFHRGR